MKNIALICALACIALPLVFGLFALGFFAAGDQAAGWGAIFALFLIGLPALCLGGWLLRIFDLSLRTVFDAWFPRKTQGLSMPKVGRRQTADRQQRWPLLTILCFVAALVWFVIYGPLCLIAVINAEWDILWRTLPALLIPTAILLTVGQLIRRAASA